MTSLIYGANHDYYIDFDTAVPAGTHGYRTYWDSVLEVTADVPTAWPSDFPTNYVTYSLRPDPVPLLAGDLDAALTALIATAPNHAELTVWHEAGPGNPLGFPDYITAQSVTAMHAHMQALCSSTLNASGGHVKYGCIITGPANQMPDWLGVGLDWYGVDIYDNPRLQNADGSVSETKIRQRMDANMAAWSAVATNPSVRITESNSPHDDHRNLFWDALSNWMVFNNGHRLYTYWNPTGALSGPWPPGQSVIDYWNTTLQPVYGVA